MVPMPRSHQVENARYFADRSAGLFLSEAETFSKQFGDLVVGLLSDSERTTGFSKEISKLNDPSAARRVAGLVAVLVENKDS
jgi:UDP-N-acetylglucosamine:LPS N-acetylglucosamine transferase